MKKQFILLIINPGSTSTKIAIYENKNQVLVKILKHNYENLLNYKKVINQKQFRKNIILETLIENQIDIKKIDAIVARGGLLHSLSGGTYLINQLMIDDLLNAEYGEHAANLGAIIADELAKQWNIPAYIVDPVVVDEMLPISKVTGLPEIKRKSIFHALNQKSVARKAAQKIGKSYDMSNFIVCHMGGGISVGAHHLGKVVDVNNGFDGEGPFTPERSGSLPVGDLVALCFSKDMTEEIIKKKIVGNGGLVAHLGTNSLIEVEKMIESGNKHAAFIFDALVYSISKEIGKMSVSIKGNVDAIILTGGLANSKKLVTNISNYVDWIAQVEVYPGENELIALVEGALRVFNKEEDVKTYNREGTFVD